uniref:F-box/kelch-repeat protein At3g23880-like isoform X2 n=1 Tax=Nicotiana sylvestris TaxID=4096 RepID=A0A1U7W087_NICSY|nr:PREDICTED: F-box/kelch-repeat protein At3g23880-like isoform X2 [Nicotiana sylvestris]
MESKVDEASYQHPKPSKSTKCAQYPSSLRQDSNLTIPILPAELVTEILSRLPMKPLLQFMCVSKSWLSLISSPEFIKTHLILSANNMDYIHHKVMMSSYSRHTSNVKVCSLRSLFYDSGIQAFDLDCPMISYGRYRHSNLASASKQALLLWDYILQLDTGVSCGYLVLITWRYVCVVFTFERVKCYSKTFSS